jgi:hypothetical protein
MPRSHQTFLKLRSWFTGRLTGAGRQAFSFVIGLLIALVLDYVLYRIGLPSKPFIYVAF